MIQAKLKERVVNVAREMENNQLVSSSGTGYVAGNVSARETNNIAITPSGLAYEELRPEDIVVIDEDGNIVAGDKKPSSETPMHTYIYRHKEGIKGIVHTHSPFATTIASIHQEIPVVVSELALTVGGKVPLTEYATAGTAEMGKNAIKTLEHKTATLFPNHGAVSIGQTVEEALNVATIVEQAAKIYYRALALKKVEVIPEKEVKKLRKIFLERYGQEKE